jgi:integrase/recombinase XerC
MSIQNAMDDFLDDLALSRRLSHHTVRAYENDLMDWFSFLKKQNILTLEELNLRLEPVQLRAYLASLSDHAAKTTLCRRLSAIRSFVKYAKNKKWLDKDVTQLITNPKIPKKLPRYLKIEDMQQLVESPDTQTLLGRRDRALFELIYGSGLRVSEAVTSIPDSHCPKPKLCSKLTTTYSRGNIADILYKFFGKLRICVFLPVKNRS